MEKTENKMGTMPVNKLLISMALPLIASMVVQALYNIVDSFFVSKISQDALNAVSLAFPVQNLMISVAVGTGVGMSALLSRSLGEKQQKLADKTAMNGLFLAVVSCGAFMVLGLTCAGVFYSVQTDIPGIVNSGTAYMRICCGASISIFLEITCERLLQATGRAFYAMISQTVGALTNMILDPILIFGMFGLPRLEVAGAALATVIGQTAGAALSIFFNLKHNPDIHLKIKGFRPDGGIIRKIYSVGVPTIVMQSIGSVMVFGINRILLSFTDTATAVFGVYFKLQSFVFMPVFGLNNAMVPIIAYNYGAMRPQRIIKTIKLSVMYAVGIMLIGFALFQAIPDVFISLFEAEESSGDMLAIGVPALRTISWCFILAGFSVVCGSVFQALGNAGFSLAMSFVRQLVVLLPMAYLLANLGGLPAVWWAFPIAELAAMAMSSIFLLRLYRKKIKPMATED